MKLEFDFFKTTMPNSRKADYYLGCLDGSVFLDFNKTKDKRIYLSRISFDGYGCCEIKKNAIYLSEQSSTEFIAIIDSYILNQEKITKKVLELIQLNTENIWNDALLEYNLIDKK
jgi:hypothetical protein